MSIAKTYRPVVRSTHGDYSGAALVGANSVIIGWDVAAGSRPSDLMGFAVRRTDFDPDSEEVLAVKWLNGMKRFKGVEDDFGADVRSDQAPFQRFRWSDYTVNPSRSYRYDVFPMRGRPGRLERDDSLTFDLRPSAQEADGIGVYTNRGVTAAMAYLRRFEGKHPADVPDGAAFRWLERGLKQSLLDFVAGARRGQALHVCIYELFLEEIADALRAAKGRGVDVAVVYHAKPDDKATKENEHVIEHARIKGISKARTRTGNISHNKFVVLLDAAGRPLRLWTASSNFSQNAFYFQTNVGLTFDSRDMAAAYERYFQILRRDPARGRKKRGAVHAQDEVEALNAALDAEPPAAVSRILFSPVRSLHVVDAAVGLIGEARSAIFLSAPFGVGKEIVAAIDANDNDILEYGLANTTAKKKIEGLRHRNTRFFTPSRLVKLAGEPWDAKAFGAHKIHSKTLVVDPWGEAPAVLMGSANFSEGSCKSNDENTILVRGDKRFAAMIATEFLRMYDHYKIRYWLNRIADSPDRAPLYLDDRPTWSNIYFRRTNRSRKFRDREVFAGRE